MSCLRPRNELEAWACLVLGTPATWLIALSLGAAWLSGVWWIGLPGAIVLAVWVSVALSDRQ